MNMIKKLLAGLAVLAFTFTVSAQQFGLTPIYDSGWGRWLPTVSATNLTSTQGLIPCTDYHELLVCLSGIATNGASSFGGYLSNSTALVMMMHPAASSTLVDTNVVYAFGVYGETNLALGMAFGCTNIEVGAWPYLKVMWISNSLLNISYSNVMIRVSGKPRQREYR